MASTTVCAFLKVCSEVVLCRRGSWSESKRASPLRTLRGNGQYIEGKLFWRQFLRGGFDLGRVHSWRHPRAREQTWRRPGCRAQAAHPVRHRTRGCPHRRNLPPPPPPTPRYYDVGTCSCTARCSTRSPAARPGATPPATGVSSQMCVLELARSAARLSKGGSPEPCSQLAAQLAF